jgi:hypothetical protein
VLPFRFFVVVISRRKTAGTSNKRKNMRKINTMLIRQMRVLGMILIGVLWGKTGTFPANAGDQVPCNGYLIANAEPLGEPDASGWMPVHYFGSGRLTILGPFTLDAQARINVVTLEFEGSGVFTTPNGDEVFSDFEGHLEPTGEAGVFTNIETAIFTGGTGRFEGASGVSLAGGTGDPFGPNFFIPIEGTISSPGANKK